MDVVPGPDTHACVNYNKDPIWKQKTFKVSQDWRMNQRIIRPDQGSSWPRQTQTEREHQQHDAPPINKEPCSKRGTIHFSWLHSSLSLTFCCGDYDASFLWDLDIWTRWSQFIGTDLMFLPCLWLPVNQLIPADVNISPSQLTNVLFL